MPMTSAAFIVFTLYMVPDPATTPLKPWRQAAFGFAVAMVYGDHPDAASGLRLVFCLAGGLRGPRNFAAPLLLRSNRAAGGESGANCIGPDAAAGNS